MQKWMSVTMTAHQTACACLCMGTKLLERQRCQLHSPCGKLREVQDSNCQSHLVLALSYSLMRMWFGLMRYYNHYLTIMILRWAFILLIITLFSEWVDWKYCESRMSTALRIWCFHIKTNSLVIKWVLHESPCCNHACQRRISWACSILVVFIYGLLCQFIYLSTSMQFFAALKIRNWNPFAHLKRIPAILLLAPSCCACKMAKNHTVLHSAGAKDVVCVAIKINFQIDKFVRAHFFG